MTARDAGTISGLMTIPLGPRLRVALVLALLSFSVVVVAPFDLPGLFGSPDFAWASWCYAFAVPVLAIAWASGARLNSALLWPMVAYLSWVALTAAVGVDPRHSYQQLAMLFGIVLAAFAGGWISLLDRRATMWALGALTLMCTVLQVLAFMHHTEVGLAQRITGYLLPEGWGGYPELGLLVAVQFAVLFAALLSWRSPAAQLALLLLIGLTIAEAVFLYARLAWVSVALVVVALPLISGLRRRMLAPLAAAVVVAGLLVSGLAAASPSFRQLGLGVLSGNFGGAGTVESGVTLNVANFARRQNVWQKATRMISDHWVTGVGLGNFRAVFERDYHPEVEDDGRRGVHAHNAFLQQAAELGVAGGVLFAGLWLVGFAGGFRSSPGAGRTAVLGALLVVLLQSLGDYYSYSLSGARGRLTFVIVLFIATASSRMARSRARTGRSAATDAVTTS